MEGVNVPPHPLRCRPPACAAVLAGSSGGSSVSRCCAGGDDDPYLLSWRGLDCPGYYMNDREQYVQLLNYSGCGNTVNANHLPMKELILHSLRWCGHVASCLGWPFGCCGASQLRR